MSDDEKVRTDAAGVPLTLIKRADTRGRRLYVDDQPFPYATSGDYALQAERRGTFTVLWVPLVVMESVTLTTAPHRDPIGRVDHQIVPAEINSGGDPDNLLRHAAQLEADADRLTQTARLCRERAADAAQEADRG